MTWLPSILTAPLRWLAQGWQAFFHAPCDARVCALVRMAFAVVVLLDLSILYPDLELWFTDAGVLPTDISHKLARASTWSLFWHLPSTSAVVQVCFWIMVLHAVLLLLGVLPNVQALALFVWLTSIENRNWLIIDGEEAVFRLLAFYLIWIPTGRCWSVDAWVRRRWRSRLGSSPDNANASATTAGLYAAPGWGLRLLQIQMCLMFLSAGICKLGGEPWRDGTALYYVARLEDYFGRLPTPTWLFDTPWTVALMTWSVIAVELLAPPLLWFRRTRRMALAGVVLFHLANEWTMHLFLFHWVMLAGWLSFLQPEDFTWVSRRFRNNAREQRA